MHNGWLQHGGRLGPSRGHDPAPPRVVATSPLRGCGVEEPDIPLLAVHRRDGRTCHGIEAEHGPARNGGRERDMFLVPRVDKKYYLAGESDEAKRYTLYPGHCVYVISAQRQSKH